jgi:cell volume regulation protein A
VDPEDADFFGAFTVDPLRPATDLEAIYGPPLSEAERKLTIGGLIVARLGGHAEYADRVMLDPIELIVRDVDEKGKVLGVGISLEPMSTRQPSVPIFLSGGEIWDRLKALGARLRPTAPVAGSEATIPVQNIKAED